MLSIGPHRDREAHARDDAMSAWEEFASEISAVELEIAEASSAATRRGIWADRNTAAPGHHERNLLENVRVAIAKLKECI
jgi:hypothetical protein